MRGILNQKSVTSAVGGGSHLHSTESCGNSCGFVRFGKLLKLAFRICYLGEPLRLLRETS